MARDKIRPPVALSWREVSAAPAVRKGGWAEELVWSTPPVFYGGESRLNGRPVGAPCIVPTVNPRLAVLNRGN